MKNFLTRHEAGSVKGLRLTADNSSSSLSKPRDTSTGQRGLIVQNVTSTTATAQHNAIVIYDTTTELEALHNKGVVGGAPVQDDAHLRLTFFN